MKYVVNNEEMLCHLRRGSWQCISLCTNVQQPRNDGLHFRESENKLLLHPNLRDKVQ